MLGRATAAATAAAGRRGRASLLASASAAGRAAGVSTTAATPAPAAPDLKVQGKAAAKGVSSVWCGVVGSVGVWCGVWDREGGSERLCIYVCMMDVRVSGWVNVDWHSRLADLHT